MKKLIALLLVLCTVLPLCACADKADSKDTTAAEEATEETLPPEPPQFTEDPAADDTLNILFIGHSFSYYFTNELYGMLTEAGIKARVCNLYYSGCHLEQHHDWLINDQANYQEFVTIDDNGRTSIKDEDQPISMREAIASQNWDVISLQPGIDFYERTSAVMLDETATARRDLLNFLKQKFPQADLYWHQFWAFQIGMQMGDYVVTTEMDQDNYYKEVLAFAKATCEEYGLERVNTGYAWQLVRKGGYDNLCARMAIKNGEGDYYHDGDIGGGQYLNACVWFEYLSGQSCIGNTFRPDDCTYGEGEPYTLSEELITTLQNAAHEAVANRDYE